MATLRFQDRVTNQNSTPERVTFKKKSNYQLRRDQARQARYERPFTRSQTESQSEHISIEHPRSDDFSLGTAHPTCLSPESVHGVLLSPDPIVTEALFESRLFQLVYRLCNWLVKILRHLQHLRLYQL